MRTHPIFHSSDAAIRGHVFCSFLALLMQKHLDDLARQAGFVPQWAELLRDLDRLQHACVRHGERDWLVRTDAAPSVIALFRIAQIAIPPRVRQPSPPTAPSTRKSRRSRPRRSATSA